MADSRNYCRWYDETSAVKRAYDAGLIDKHWVEDYCWSGGKNCIRKQRWEGESYISPCYVLPDGTEDETLRAAYEEDSFR